MSSTWEALAAFQRAAPMIEIWESEADSQKFFNENLKPNLPPGVVPDFTYYELHAAFTR